MRVRDFETSSLLREVRVTETIPEGVAVRATARRADGLGERIVNYLFGHGPGVGHLAMCSAVGGMLGGCVGFGIGVVPGAAIGAVVGAALVDGLTFAFFVITTRVGCRSGESRDDNGATESDGASTDSGSTTATEDVEEMLALSDEYDGDDEDESGGTGGEVAPFGWNSYEWDRYGARLVTVGWLGQHIPGAWVATCAGARLRDEIEITVEFRF
ncbi:MAG: hypothetical protein OXF02_05980 [Simkaniaceae bacterium]|nr:hypothetical protein [Simkaniaceae bacterium]